MIRWRLREAMAILVKYSCSKHVPQLSSPGPKPLAPKPKNPKRGLGLTLKSHGLDLIDPRSSLKIYVYFTVSSELALCSSGCVLVAEWHAARGTDRLNLGFGFLSSGCLNTDCKADLLSHEGVNHYHSQSVLVAPSVPFHSCIPKGTIFPLVV